MHKLSYRITSLAPLVISGGHGDMNMVSTGEYIPGTTVLGLLAGRFIKETGSGKPHEDDKFNHWFLAGGLTFGAACIASDPDAGSGKAYWPTPVSIRRDKHKDLVYDMLFHESEKDLETRAARRFCNLDGGGFKTMDVNTDLNFHHARDRQKGIPLEGRIFNYESINPGQRFEGEISGAPEDLLGLVKTLGRRWTAYAGRSRSVQYGAVKFEILDDAPAAVPAAPRTEIDKNGRLSLTLLSDAILYNDCGFPTADKETAQKYLGGVKIIKAFIKTRRVENFISVWRLKKPTEVCLSAGSSFLLEVTDRDA
ncbi:MAG: hypothetical protein GY859_25955, partial [Desulfobacterales bacterium]|nr:hypothetical protein [Desulfobacterales bacterium]